VTLAATGSQGQAASGVPVGPLSGHAAAIGPNGRYRTHDQTFRLRCRHLLTLRSTGSESKETRPFARVLGTGNLPIGTVQYGVQPIAEQPCSVTWISTHLLPSIDLTGVAPQQTLPTQLGLRWCDMLQSPFALFNPEFFARTEARSF